MQFNGGLLMNIKLVSVVAGVAMLGGVAQASAAIMDVTYTATVSSGTDTFGVFGTAGANLTGKPWVATYTFDTLSSPSYSSSSSSQNDVYGGSVYPNTSPVLSSMITIGGVSKAVGGSYFGWDFGYNDGRTSKQYQQAQNYSSRPYEYPTNDLFKNN